MIKETNRLIIRLFTEEDLKALHHIVSDPEVMRFSLKGPLSEEETKAFLKNRILNHYKECGYGLYAVIHKKDQKLIGFIGLLNQTIDGESKVELGYRFNPHYWGKGYASEAAQAVINHAFTKLNLKELISIIDPRNLNSLRVAERNGMTLWKTTFFHDIPVNIYCLYNCAATESTS